MLISLYLIQRFIQIQADRHQNQLLPAQLQNLPLQVKLLRRRILHKSQCHTAMYMLHLLLWALMQISVSKHSRRLRLIVARHLSFAMLLVLTTVSRCRSTKQSKRRLLQQAIGTCSDIILLSLPRARIRSALIQRLRAQIMLSLLRAKQDIPLLSAHSRARQKSSSALQPKTQLKSITSSQNLLIIMHPMQNN